MTSSSAAARAGLATAAVVAAFAHLPVIAPHLRDAPYMGVLFAAFTGVCLAIAAAAVLRPGAPVYRAAGAVCGAGVATYVATRLVAFPQLADDVGHWLEPLGVLSVLAESVVVGCAAVLLRSARRVPVAAR